MDNDQEYKYMVSTRCFTFNQSTYIEDALHGFAMQETPWPVNTIVVDDASTDGEQEVLLRWANENMALKSDGSSERDTDYAHIIEATLKNNSNHTFAILLLHENHYGKKNKSLYLKEWMDTAKYHAICEGDDFWIDSKKLYLQATFLESHPEHSLCFHAVKRLLPDGTTQRSYRYRCDVEDCPIDDFFASGGGGFAPTCSLMYVKDKSIPKPSFWQKSAVGDSPLMLTLFLRGKVCFVHREMGCYRVNAAGSWSERQKNLTLKQIKDKYAKEWAYWNEVNRYTKRDYYKFVRNCKRHLLLSLGKSLLYFTRNKFCTLF